MNKQEIVNKVYDHYIIRKEPFGYNGARGGCTYTNPPCAIGIFLTDDDAATITDVRGKDWDDEIESLIVDIYSNGYQLSGPLKEFVLKEENEDYDPELDAEEDEFLFAAPFLQELQSCHDDSACAGSVSGINGPSPRTPEDSIKELKKKLKELCNRHVLTYPGLDD